MALMAWHGPRVVAILLLLLTVRQIEAEAPVMPYMEDSVVVVDGFLEPGARAVILWRSQAHIPSPLLLAWVTQWTTFLGLAEGFRVSIFLSLLSSSDIEPLTHIGFR